MDANQHHIIQTICFDANADSEESAVAFTDAVSGLNHEQLFNEVLSRYSNAKETIQLQKVELDIGEFNTDNLYSIKKILLSKFEDAIKQQLKNKHSINQNAAFTVAKKNSSAANDTYATDPIDKLSPEKCIELIVYYFKTGGLPWHITSQPDIEKLIENLLKHNPVVLKKYLLPHLRNECVIKRMIITLRHQVIAKLIITLTGQSVFYPVETFITAVKKIVPSAKLAEFNKLVASNYLKSAGETGNSAHIFSDIFFSHLENILQFFSNSLLKILFAEVQQLLFNENSREVESIYKNALVQISKIIDKSKYLSENETQVKSIADSTDNNAAEEIKADKVSNELAQELAETEPGDNNANHFIDNAGLVLLNAALLQKTFEGLSWVKEKKIVDDKSRDKILLWMDYLVWGKRKTHEYGLMLNKVMLGIEPEDIVDISLTLTAEEMDKADELLETVIQHWSILKNTSVDGFRNSFLQRNGRLGNEDGGWQLFVKTKGFDILIESLPWSFSIIKFPWMKKPLFTQWQTKV